MKKAVHIAFFFLFSLAMMAEEADSTLREEKVAVRKKDPKTALYLSVIPGAGQFYNEKYWKAPVFFGAAATLIGFYIYFDNNFTKYSDEINILTDMNRQIPLDETPSNSPYYPINEYRISQSEYEILKQRREQNRDRRDQMLFYTIGVWVISAIDAYADANLFDFNVDENLEIMAGPDIYGGFSLNFRYYK